MCGSSLKDVIFRGVLSEQEDKRKAEKESEENLQGKKDGRGHNVSRAVNGEMMRRSMNNASLPGDGDGDGGKGKGKASGRRFLPRRLGGAVRLCLVRNCCLR